jgi:hypothetical protein
MPLFTSKVLSLDLHVRPQADALGGDAIPGLTECLRNFSHSKKFPGFQVSAECGSLTLGT